MEDKIVKEKSKFIDNVAYKSKFQFLIWINDNVICQRYFKINGFNEGSIHTAEFQDCMDGIVRSIQEDLDSKSRIFMWYTNYQESLKLTGFLTDEEAERYGDDFVAVMSSSKIRGDVEAPDGKIFHKTYMDYPENTYPDWGDNERPQDGEYFFKFSFLIDDVPAYERIWHGNVYPKFVRNGVDLTNNYGLWKADNSSLSLNASIIRDMQAGKINLISDFIRRICDTLSNTYTEKYDYTKEFQHYMNNNKIDKEKFDEASKIYGNKSLAIGHTEIKKQKKTYTYLSPWEEEKQSWEKATRKKTQDYFTNLFPSPKQIEFIDKHY